MSTFKELVWKFGDEALARLEAQETAQIVNREDSQLSEALRKLEKNSEDAIDRAIRRSEEEFTEINTPLDVLAGYDSKYMSRNDYRVAYRTRFAEQRRKNAQTKAQERNDDLWAYTFASIGAVEAPRTKVQKFNFKDTRDNSAIWKSVMGINENHDLDYAKIRLMNIATLKKNKISSLNKGIDSEISFDLKPSFSFVPSSPKFKSAKFNGIKKIVKESKPIGIRKMNRKDGFTGFAPATYVSVNKETRKPIAKDIVETETILIKNFTLYREAIILEAEKVFDIRTDYYKRSEHDSSSFHYIFRYQPLTSNGKPNEKCGLKLLCKLLKTIPAVNVAEPTNLGDALRASIGCTVDIEIYPSFSWESSSTTSCNLNVVRYNNGNVRKYFNPVHTDHDTGTVFKVYGSIDEFTSMADYTPAFKIHPYQLISEYSERDDDAIDTEYNIFCSFSTGTEDIAPVVENISSDAILELIRNGRNIDVYYTTFEEIEGKQVKIPHYQHSVALA